MCFSAGKFQSFTVEFTALIYTVPERIYVEYIYRISSLSAIQFKWFKSQRFNDKTMKIHTGKTIMDNLTGEMHLT